MAEPDYTKLRLSLQGGMRRWIEQGVMPGGFLRAVLENNLSEAVGRADAFNEPYLPHLVRWLYAEAPGMCWGSPERVAAWPEILKNLQQLESRDGRKD